MELFEKAKKCVFEWSNRVENLWAEGRYIRSGLTCVLPPTLVGLLIVLIIKAITAGFNFVRHYYAQLIFAALAVCVFIAWLDKRKAENVEIARKEQEIRERQNYTDQWDAVQTQDATYTAGAKVLFPVSRELGPLGIVPPAKLSELYSPGRSVVKANGTVSLNLYLLQKDREVVETDLIMHTLQTKTDQRLQAGEFPGIPEQHIYRGRVYSGFVVDMVRDSMNDEIIEAMTYKFFGFEFIPGTVVQNPFSTKNRPAPKVNAMDLYRDMTDGATPLADPPKAEKVNPFGPMEPIKVVDPPTGAVENPFASIPIDGEMLPAFDGI